MSSLFAFPAELRRGHEDLLRLAQTVAQHGVTSAMVELTSEAGVSADGCGQNERIIWSLGWLCPMKVGNIGTTEVKINELGTDALSYLSLETCKTHVTRLRSE